MRAEVSEALDSALSIGGGDMGLGARRSRSRMTPEDLRAYVYAVLVELTDFTVQELCDELCIASAQGKHPADER